MLDIYKLKKNKVKNDILINKVGLPVGEIKHYPAATKEWFNGIYAFNKNTIKSLPSADVYVAKLIKSYFNLFSWKFEAKARLYVERFKIRRLKMNRIILGKPEFKHTNDKVTITLYIYNQELAEYKKKLNNMKIKNTSFFYDFFLLDKDAAIKFSSNDDFNINIPSVIGAGLKKIFSNFIKQVKNLKYIDDLKHSDFKIENIPLLLLVKKILVKLKFYYQIKKIIHLNKHKFNSIHIYPLKTLLEKIYRKEVVFNIVSLKRYNLNSSILMRIMTIKLRDRKNRLLRVVRKVLTRISLPYTRRLEYPIKTIKDLKINNLIVRDNFYNNYFKIVPYIKFSNFFFSKDLTTYRIKKVSIKKFTGDNLNILLKSLYPKQYLMYIDKKGYHVDQHAIDNFKNQLSRNDGLDLVSGNADKLKILARFDDYIKSECLLPKNILCIKVRSLENTVLDRMKNKVISGVRIEASGRLSKRLIASRAVFEMRQKGTIRNINSSYTQMSSVLLRGFVKSNLDFSRSKNKTRIGAFGLKGWVSST